MTRTNPLKIIAAIALVSVLSSYGCILNPEKGEPDVPPVVIDWPELTDKEAVIETISLVYEHYRQGSDELIEHYTTVLYDDPSNDHDYVWNMQEGDIIAGHNPIMLRDEDIQGTRFILENASALTLDISAGAWDPIPDVCEECWETTRTYTISAKMFIGGEDMTFNGDNMRVNFVVGPNEQVPGTWTIYIASDLPGTN